MIKRKIRFLCVQFNRIYGQGDKKSPQGCSKQSYRECNRTSDTCSKLNHCLSFEQVSDELIEQYGIPIGNYDTVSSCRYDVPSVTAIGRVYQRLVLSVFGLEHAAQGIREVFSSFISDAISDFETSVYYSNPDYLRCSYEDGYLLD